MKSWKESSTNMEGKQHGLQCFSNLFVANLLFSILIRLRLGLLIKDVCTRFKIPEATYSRMFTTWICLLSKELTTWICLLSKELTTRIYLLSKEHHQIFPFPSCEQVSQQMPRRFKKHFPTRELLQTVMRQNVNDHLSQ